MMLKQYFPLLLLTIPLGLVACGGGASTQSGSTSETDSTPTGVSDSAPSAEQAPQTAKALNIQWVKVEGGEFLMGSPDSDSLAEDREKPQHRVKLSSFWMSATEVTNAQYDQFLASLPDDSPHKGSGSEYKDMAERFKRPRHPVVCVSYEDAMAFCEWLGNGVTLPTEAQWEYACHAGSSEAYGLGEDGQQIVRETLANYAWYGEDDFTGGTHPVGKDGKNRANAFGFYDMHGSVCEWCSDWYGEGYYQSCKGTEGASVENPRGSDAGESRMLRGGSWLNESAACRSAFRGYGHPTERIGLVGFRIVAPVAP